MQMVRCVVEHLPVGIGIEVRIVEYENWEMKVNRTCPQADSQADKQRTFAVSVSICKLFNLYQEMRSSHVRFFRDNIWPF